MKHASKIICILGCFLLAGVFVMNMYNITRGAGGGATINVGEPVHVARLQSLFLGKSWLNDSSFAEIYAGEKGLNIKNGLIVYGEKNVPSVGDSSAVIIGGGESNIISSVSNAGIVGGHSNKVGSDYGVIGGGKGNEVSGLGGLVAGGLGNKVSANSGVVVGGYDNYIGSLGNTSLILGGKSKDSLGRNNLVFGRYVQVNGKDSFVWNDLLMNDFNGDDKVDVADMVCFVNAFGTGDENCRFDLNRDDGVDVADFVTNVNLVGTEQKVSVNVNDGAYIGVSSGLLIGTYQPKNGVNLVVSGAIFLGSSDEPDNGTGGEIMVRDGCFYAYDGKTWHVLGKSSESKCDSLNGKAEVNNWATCSKADLDGNGSVNLTDFLIMETVYSPEGCGSLPTHLQSACGKADLDGNGSVNLSDWLLFNDLWPECYASRSLTCKFGNTYIQDGDTVIGYTQPVAVNCEDVKCVQTCAGGNDIDLYLSCTNVSEDLINLDEAVVKSCDGSKGNGGESGKCNPFYQNGMFTNLTAGNHLCTVGTYANFKYHGSSHVWTWSCIPESGLGVSCQANNKINGYACVGSIPENATLIEGSDNNLESDVTRRLYESVGAAGTNKCAYVCSTGFEYSGAVYTGYLYTGVVNSGAGNTGFSYYVPGCVRIGNYNLSNYQPGEYCGDGKINGSEECDEGRNNGKAGSSCSAQCKLVDSCESGKWDVNGDGKVDRGDINEIVNFMNKETYDSEADLDGDGHIDIVDYQYLLNIMSSCGFGGGVYCGIQDGWSKYFSSKQTQPWLTSTTPGMCVDGWTVGLPSVKGTDSHLEWTCSKDGKSETCEAYQQWCGDGEINRECSKLDYNGDGRVDAADEGFKLNNIDKCLNKSFGGGDTCAKFDVNGDGRVDAIDEQYEKNNKNECMGKTREEECDEGVNNGVSDTCDLSCKKGYDDNWCEAGYYRNAAGECVLTLPGTYSRKGKADYTICPSGTHSNAGASSIDDCREYEDLDVYILGQTGRVVRYSLMDRNLGATELYNQDVDNPNSESFGYHYQWGNNYGFASCLDSSLSRCTTLPNGESTSSTRVTIKSSDVPSKYASNVLITYNGPWMNGCTNGCSDNVKDLWGGVTNTNDARQGPCPSGYHVPSKSEFNSLLSSWKSALNIDSEYYGGEQFAYDLLLPPSGYRDMRTLVVSPDSGVAKLLTSNGIKYTIINGYTIIAMFVTGKGRFYAGYDEKVAPIGLRDDYDVYDGLAVRCMKNSKNNNVTIHSNGGVGAIVSVAGGVIKSLGTPTKQNYTFQGWYSDSSFTHRVEVGDMAPQHLYAKYGN